jgi:multimeric flavodoxin WrbA
MVFEEEYLYLGDAGIEYCVGCHNCIFLGEKKCPHYYFVSQVEKKMMEADIILLASPGYMFSVTGVMKVFLDHVAYNCHRPKYFDKKLVLIGNFTKWQQKGVFIPMETWASGAGFRISGKLWMDLLPFPLNEDAMNTKKKKLEKDIVKISKNLISNKDRKVKFGDIAIYHSLRTLCQIAPDILTADYDYFREIDAYKKTSKWYIPIKVPLIYSMIGRLLEIMIRRQVSGSTDMDKLKTIKGRYVTRLIDND